MSRHSPAHSSLCRQVAKRRRDLLRTNGRVLFYPPIGTAWTPTEAESVFADAFIVLFVAELETYLEWVIESSLEQFKLGLLSSGLAECGAATSYIDKVREKEQALTKNHNANWDKVFHFFEFVGFKKGSFPGDFWDDVELVVRERGNIAHKSLGLRAVSDPRLVLAKIDLVLRNLRTFDRDYWFWLAVRKAELGRVSQLELRFQPGMGTLGTNMAI